MARKKEEREALKGFAMRAFTLGMSQKYIAEKLDIPESTVSRWKNEEGWDKLTANRTYENLEIIDNLQRYMMSIAKFDQIANQFPDLEKIKANLDIIERLAPTKIPFSEYKTVMEEFISFLISKDEMELSKRLIDFQDEFIKKVINDKK